MIRKMFILFLRDLKVNTRDFFALYMLLIPIIMAIVFNLLAPGINDTLLNLAFIEGENPDMVEYYKDFAKVSVHKDRESLNERVNRRDDVFGIVKEGSEYELVVQGNESENYIEFTQLYLVFYEEGILLEDTNATIFSFNRTVPPLKKMLVNIAIMFTSIMGGMVIAMNIIEERNDMTIRSIHLTPISKRGYLFGKSMIGAFLPMYGSVALILICGFGGINWGQMALIVAVSTVISILVGFVQGIVNQTFMDAAGSVKMLFVPLAGAVAVAELVSEKWQWTVYWIPFYWSYLATDKVLAQTSKWGFTLMACGIVLVMSILAYLAMMPKIKKGLL